jgi:hypothetical protein
MKQAELQSFKNYIFGQTHVPVWKPKYGSRYITLPTMFPTSKNPNRMVDARLPLMRFGLMQWDVDPQVVAISAFPFKTEYWSLTSKGDPVKRVHVPDLAVMMRDGSVRCMDYIPVAIQTERAWQKTKTAQLVSHYAEEFGWPYAVLDEYDIYQQPMFSNVQLLWRYKPCTADPLVLTEVRQTVARTSMPTTVDAICDVLTRDDPMINGLGQEADSYVFTAIMQLLIEGVLIVDMSKPISRNTTITSAKGATK